MRDIFGQIFYFTGSVKNVWKTNNLPTFKKENIFIIPRQTQYFEICQ